MLDNTHDSVADRFLSAQTYTALKSVSLNLRPSQYLLCRGAKWAIALLLIHRNTYSGPAHPFNKDGLAAGMRNHRAGHVEVSHTTVPE